MTEGRNGGAGRVYAVIAGSGFQRLAGDSTGKELKTCFGPPSGPLRKLNYGERFAYLLLRHGDNMLIPPHAINYRANMKALSQSGVTDVIAVNTVGVIAANVDPGQIAVPDQLIDYTYGRDHSIYGADSATLDHIDFTEPLNAGMRRELLQAASTAGIACENGGVYGVTQGPRLETAAEVDRLERDGVDYVGMTAMPEASLAMELNMRYACLSLVVNYAAGRGEKGIHEDIEESTQSARTQTMKMLEAFFSSR